jgi:hypothetical protein
MSRHLGQVARVPINKRNSNSLAYASSPGTDRPSTCAVPPPVANKALVPVSVKTVLPQGAIDRQPQVANPTIACGPTKDPPKCRRHKHTKPDEREAEVLLRATHNFIPRALSPPIFSYPYQSWPLSVRPDPVGTNDQTPSSAADSVPVLDIR